MKGTGFFPRDILEFFHNNEWRAVCDSGFTSAEGKVACRQLGFFGFKSEYCCGSYFGKYWLNGLDCSGEESKLTQCRFTSYETTKCGFSDAVELTCASRSYLNFETSDEMHGPITYIVMYD